MNFSSVAISNDRKEAKVLKSFLAFSLRVVRVVTLPAAASAQVARSSGNSALDEAAQAKYGDQGSARKTSDNEL